MRSNFGWVLALVFCLFFSTSIRTESRKISKTKLVKVPNIDLNNWKITLPIGNPTEVKPPDILDYENISILHDYLYNDTEEGALVFYTIKGSSTANSKYSRTELREQMVPGSDAKNWTFAEGGKLKGTLRVSKVSGEENDLDRVIVMQIHGRLTDEQRHVLKKDDHNAPPILKIYWDNGKLNVRRKVLKFPSVSDQDLLKVESWKDESHWFTTSVSNEPFTLEVIVTGSSMLVSLNNGAESLLFNDISIQKWGVFENYFKAGNYLQSKEKDAFSEVRYYELKVTH